MGDMDGSIETAELMQLGHARRSLGQRGGAGTKEKNDKMMSQLGGGSDGMVREGSFVKHFFGSMEELAEWEFDLMIQQFMATAAEGKSRGNKANVSGASP